MQWLKVLLARVFTKTRPQAPVVNRRPSREEINALPLFDALDLDAIVTVDSGEAAAKAFADLSQQPVVGFDTESRPTFAKGEVSTGPHVVQFATASRTYIFILHDSECRRIAGQVISSPKVLKVGFGLDSDRRQIPKRLNVHPNAMIDIATLFSKRGYGRGIGVKAAVAILFQRRFSKPRSATTSNWSRRDLTDKQLLYAANDAYAALRVYQAL
jgi:ribonuclease D